MPRPSLEQIRAYYANKPDAERPLSTLDDALSPEDEAFERGYESVETAPCVTCSRPFELEPALGGRHRTACSECYNAATPRQKHIYSTGKDRTIGETARALCLRCHGHAIARFTGWANRGRGEEQWCLWCPRCDPGPATLSSPYPRPAEPADSTSDGELA